MKSRFVFSGSSHGYVLLILFFVILVSSVLAGGIFPRLNKHPVNPEVVDVSDASGSANLDRLQLVDLQQKATDSTYVTPTPDRSCLSSSALFFLVEDSDAMAGPPGNPKIDQVRDALNAFFINGVTPTTLVELSIFSSIIPPDTQSAHELVPLGTYATNKNQLANAIAGISPSGDADMVGAFTFLKGKMDSARQLYPTASFFVIFLSNGVPTGNDPTSEVADLKSNPLNATIFSVGLDDQGDDLMRALASSPSETYFLGSSNPDQIGPSLTTVSDRLCGNQ